MSVGPMQQDGNLRTIGKYRILGTLGRGSMGVVYKAEDPEIGRVVAIKTLRTLLPGQHAEVDNLINRFTQEARSAGNLRHPNIITIFEVNRDGDIPYLVMDFIEGRSLDSIIAEKGRIEPGLAVHYLAQVAAGLDYAHSRGVIHRDIKSSNIFVDRSNNAFILDFGVAVMSEGAFAPTGAVMGTPAYMSPEQITNEPLDHRSDLFSLAIVAFEILAGERPFSGENFTVVMGNILSTRPHAISQMVASIPLSIEADFEKALSKKPVDRFNSALEFISSLAHNFGLPIPAANRHDLSNEKTIEEKPAQGRARRASTSKWKRVRQRKFSDLKIDKPNAAIIKTETAPIWHDTGKLVDDYGRVRSTVQESRSLTPAHYRPGESMFGYNQSHRAEVLDSRIPTRRRFSLTMIMTFVLLGVSVFTAVMLTIIVLSPAGTPPVVTANDSGTESSAASVAPESEDAAYNASADGGSVPGEATHAEIPSGFTVPQVDPVPDGKPVYEMTDRELLGVLVGGGVADEIIVSAIKEAEARRVGELLEASIFPLRSDSSVVRVEAIKLLGRMGDRRAVSEIMGALEDHDPLVRAHAARALGSLGDRRAVDYLSSRLTVEQNGEVKAQIERAITKINGFGASQQ